MSEQQLSTTKYCLSKHKTEKTEGVIQLHTNILTFRDYVLIPGGTSKMKMEKDTISHDRWMPMFAMIGWVQPLPWPVNSSVSQDRWMPMFAMVGWMHPQPWIPAYRPEQVSAMQRKPWKVFAPFWQWDRCLSSHWLFPTPKPLFDWLPAHQVLRSVPEPAGRSGDWRLRVFPHLQQRFLDPVHHWSARPGQWSAKLRQARTRI